MITIMIKSSRLFSQFHISPYPTGNDRKRGGINSSAEVNSQLIVGKTNIQIIIEPIKYLFGTHFLLHNVFRLRFMIDFWFFIV